MKTFAVCLDEPRLNALERASSEKDAASGISNDQFYEFADYHNAVTGENLPHWGDADAEKPVPRIRETVEALRLRVARLNQEIVGNTEDDVLGRLAMISKAAGTDDLTRQLVSRLRQGFNSGSSGVPSRVMVWLAPRGAVER